MPEEGVTPKQPGTNETVQAAFELSYSWAGAITELLPA